MLRLQSILEEGVYITPEQARAQGVKKQSLVIFYRKIGRSAPVMYHITDQPPAAKSHDWERVAAIFVTGAAWQFKEYPFKVGSSLFTVLAAVLAAQSCGILSAAILQCLPLR